MLCSLVINYEQLNMCSNNHVSLYASLSRLLHSYQMINERMGEMAFRTARDEITKLAKINAWEMSMCIQREMLKKKIKMGPSYANLMEQKTQTCRKKTKLKGHAKRRGTPNWKLHGIHTLFFLAFVNLILLLLLFLFYSDIPLGFVLLCSDRFNLDWFKVGLIGQFELETHTKWSHCTWTKSLWWLTWNAVTTNKYQNTIKMQWNGIQPSR